MPRIPDLILYSTIYLYSSVDDAKTGAPFGGSGFLTCIPYEKQIGDAYRTHTYAVTNSHVIHDGAAPVIRVTTSKGETKIIDRTIADWFDEYDYGGDDIAVCSLDIVGYQVFTISHQMYLTPEKISTLDIGVGSDTLTIGRFISHDGNQRNLPVVRFGHIAMMNDEPIEHPIWRTPQESFLVECQSNSGYSGSPVFVADTHFGDPRMRGGLLGIAWGHMHINALVKDQNNEKISQKWHVETNSGMMMVLPIWKLVNLLNSKELVAKRRKREKEVEKIIQQSKGGASLDVAKRDED